MHPNIPENTEILSATEHVDTWCIVDNSSSASAHLRLGGYEEGETGGIESFGPGLRAAIGMGIIILYVGLGDLDLVEGYPTQASLHKFDLEDGSNLKGNGNAGIF